MKLQLYGKKIKPQTWWPSDVALEKTVKAAVLNREYNIWGKKCSDKQRSTSCKVNKAWQFVYANLLNLDSYQKIL